MSVIEKVTTVCFGLLFLAAVCAGIAAVIHITTKEPPERFKVVDSYQGCSVVRYAPEYGGHYSYFLDCAGGSVTRTP